MNSLTTPPLVLEQEVTQDDQSSSSIHEKQGKASKIPNLPLLLRWCGGILMVASAIAFMYQGAFSFSPMTRHWIILGICTILGIIGVITGASLKEDKGARLFFSFSAACFPVLTSQLGAMLFSIFGKPPVNMPQPLVFTLGNISMVLAIGALTFGVILPLTYLTFKVIARSQVKLLTLLYASLNTLILVPTRDGLMTTAIISLAVIAILLCDRFRLRCDFRLNNYEGLTARILLVTPILVLLGRSTFYPMDLSYYGLILILLCGCLSFYWCNYLKNVRLKSVLQMAGQFGMTCGWGLVTFSSLSVIFQPDGFAIYTFFLPLALLFAVQSFVVEENVSGKYRLLTAIIGLVAVGLSHIVQPSPAISVIAIATALMLVVLGTLTAEKKVLIIGIISALIGFGSFSIQAFRIQESFAWAGLALIGIIAMLGASFIDSQREWKILKNQTIWGKLKKE